MQAVAVLQVVVQKTQRRPNGEGVQPQRGLGQLHCHQVLVNAEDAFLQHHAAHDVAVVELRVGHAPAVFRGLRLDAAADVRRTRHHRALPGPALFHQVRGPGLFSHQPLCGGHGFQHTVGQVIYQGHQEVAAAHGRVADLQLQDGRCRVGRVQPVPVARVQRVPFAPAGHQRLEGRHPFTGQHAHRFTQDQPHQVLVRVVAARDLARKAGRARCDAVDLGLVAVVVFGLHLVHQAVFQQAFVDAAQVADRQVAVVDPAAQHFIGAARQRVDDGRQHGIRHGGALQQLRPAAVEQAAVVGRHADGIGTVIDEQKGAAQRKPDVWHPRSEGLAGIDAVAHLFAQVPHAVRAVAGVVHRQQPPVFGVEQKQQPVKQDQRGLAHLVQVGCGVALARELAVADLLFLCLQVACGQGLGQGREDVFEDPPAQVL